MNLLTNDKKTALHISVMRGYFDISKLLIDNGADLNSVDIEKNLPIHLCAMSGHTELLNYILEKRVSGIKAKNLYGKTPLELATKEETKNVLRKFESFNNTKFNTISNSSVTKISNSLSSNKNINPYNRIKIHKASNTQVKNLMISIQNSKKLKVKKINKSSNRQTKADNIKALSKKQLTTAVNTNSTTKNANRKNMFILNTYSNCSTNNINNPAGSSLTPAFTSGNVAKEKDMNLFTISAVRGPNILISNFKTSNNSNLPSSSKEDQKKNAKQDKILDTAHKLSHDFDSESLSSHKNIKNKRKVLQVFKGPKESSKGKMQHNSAKQNNVFLNIKNPTKISPKKSTLLKRTSNNIFKEKNLNTERTISVPRFFNSAFSLEKDSYGVSIRRYFRKDSGKGKVSLDATSAGSGLDVANKVSWFSLKQHQTEVKKFNKVSGNNKNKINNNTISSFSKNNTTMNTGTKAKIDFKKNLSNSDMKEKEKALSPFKKNIYTEEANLIEDLDEEEEVAHKDKDKEKEKFKKNLNNKFKKVKNKRSSKSNKDNNRDNNKLKSIMIKNHNLFKTESENFNNEDDDFEDIEEIEDSNYDSDDLANVKETKIGPASFMCLALLGQGSFGEVYLVQKKDTQEYYAMKVLDKTRIAKQNIFKYVFAERNVLTIVNCPFIVRLNYAFQTNEKLFLLLDYCPGGDLAKQLQSLTRFPEEKAKFYLCEITIALGELHKKNIIFRDLKPDNIVIDKEGHAMLTDFGLSREFINDTEIARSFCGSIAYLAPEMLSRKGHGKSVDWYLLGVLFYEMLVGIPPYFTPNQEQIFKNIEKGQLYIPNIVSKEARELIQALLRKDPKERLGSANDVEDIKSHPYFHMIDWDKVYKREYIPPKIVRTTNCLQYYNKPKQFSDDFNEGEDDLFIKDENYEEERANKTSTDLGQNKFEGWSFIQSAK